MKIIYDTAVLLQNKIKQCNKNEDKQLTMNTVDWDTGFLVAHGAGEHWATLYIALQATQAEAVKTRQSFRRVKVVEADRACQVVLADPTTQTRHLGINSCHADLK